MTSEQSSVVPPRHTDTHTRCGNDRNLHPPRTVLHATTVRTSSGVDAGSDDTFCPPSNKDVATSIAQSSGEDIHFASLPATEPSPPLSLTLGGSGPSPSPTKDVPVPANPPSEGEELAHLRVYASGFYDAQQARIALGNRLRASTLSKDLVKDLEQGMRDTEAAMRKRAVGTFKRTFPELTEWAQATPGIGIPTLALLIGTIGDPCIARPSHWEPNPDYTEGGDEPKRTLVADAPFFRQVSQLWSYCGVGDATRRRRTGMSADDAKALGNQRAKVIIHLMATNTFIANGTHGDRSPYRDLADMWKAEYEVTRPDWTKSHRHAAALRRVKKEILRDIWLVQRDAHVASSL